MINDTCDEDWRDTADMRIARLEAAVARLNDWVAERDAAEGDAMAAFSPTPMEP